MKPVRQRTHIQFWSLTLAGALFLAPARLSGQGSTQRLVDAREQIRGQHLDSAIVLLHTITSSDADSAERAEAFVWLGVATFYQGKDSAASDAFRSALSNNPLLTPAPVLARLDSGLAVLWEHDQTIALCGELLPVWLWPSDHSRHYDALNSDARALEGPEVLSGPRLEYPDNLRRAGIQGRVVVRVVIDTSGRAERGSVRILSTPHPDFNGPVTEYIEHARFSVPVSSKGHVRACVVLPVDFSVTR